MRNNLKTLCLALTILLSLPHISVLAGNNDSKNVKVVEVFSKAMDRNIKNTIVLPETYNPNETYPVLYLLHGYGGNNDRWITKARPSLPEDATHWGMIIVCPDGENSWYWDSPQDPKSQFETYVSKELVKYIDNTYSTKASKQGRAITGYSMGGHGALWLAIRHPDVFGACGALSGGVDITPFPKKWEMETQLGTYRDNQKTWKRHTVINQLGNIESGDLAIIFDCGFDDFFFKVNENLHQELLYRNIDHHYISHPGKHDKDSWGDAIDYHFVFFSKFFRK